LGCNALTTNVCMRASNLHIKRRNAKKHPFIPLHASLFIK
jgi:hypothetical protein